MEGGARVPVLLCGGARLRRWTRPASGPAKRCTSCSPATSVGRGWDSVGHGAGTYRDRVRVRVIDAETRTDAAGR